MTVLRKVMFFVMSCDVFFPTRVWTRFMQFIFRSRLLTSIARSSSSSSSNLIAKRKRKRKIERKKTVLIERKW